MKFFLELLSDGVCTVYCRRIIIDSYVRNTRFVCIRKRKLRVQKAITSPDKLFSDAVGEIIIILISCFGEEKAPSPPPTITALLKEQQ